MREKFRLCRKNGEGGLSRCAGSEEVASRGEEARDVLGSRRRFRPLPSTSSTGSQTAAAVASAIEDILPVHVVFSTTGTLSVGLVFGEWTPAIDTRIIQFEISTHDQFRAGALEVEILVDGVVTLNPLTLNAASSLFTWGLHFEWVIPAGSLVQMRVKTVNPADTGLPLQVTLFPQTVVAG